MIIQAFTVRSRNKIYDIVDRDAIDSEAVKRQVNKMHAAALAYAQEGGKCKARGLPDRQGLDNWVLAVFDGVELIGIFMLGSITYVSGPWENLQTWEVTEPGAYVHIEAVPMPGVLSMAQDIEEDFAADILDAVLSEPLRMISGQGLSVNLDKLHYGILLDLDDTMSKRAQGQHAGMKAHPGLSVVETQHATIAGLTIVEIRAR